MYIVVVAITSFANVVIVCSCHCSVLTHLVAVVVALTVFTVVLVVAAVTTTVIVFVVTFEVVVHTQKL